MKKIIKIFFMLIVTLLFSEQPNALAQGELSFLKDFLNDIEYSTRFELEADDNIFLEEDLEDSELKEIVMQSFRYKKSLQNHFIQAKYIGKYVTYTEERTNVLSQYASFLYSYRPFEKFSIGLKHSYSYLSDNEINMTLGDRVLSFGYLKNTPSVELKYEISPRTRVKTDFVYEKLDGSNAANDDYIDNEKLKGIAEFEFDITEKADLIGFFGYDYGQIDFAQITEKSAKSSRPYFGLTKKFIGLLNWKTEIGFENIDMDDENNVDDSNIDYKTIFETTFSLHTKVTLSLGYNTKKPSLRRGYTQYTTDSAALGINHAINKKTSLFLDYVYQRQHFESSDHTVGRSAIDRKTYIHDASITLVRKLKPWLSIEGQYNYTKRNTDFAQEGYTNNKWSLALTAKY